LEHLRCNLGRRKHKIVDRIIAAPHLIQRLHQLFGSDIAWCVGGNPGANGFDHFLPVHCRTEQNDADVRVRAFDGACDFQTIDTRQVDFHHDHVGVECIDDLNGLLTIARFADHAKLRRLGQMMTQPFAKQRMRVDQHDRG
jgi:hypothetical protein